MRLSVTGASGFIGGSIAAEPVRQGHQIRWLIRSAEKAEACEAFGVVPVHGTLADHDLLADEAALPTRLSTPLAAMIAMPSTSF